MHATIKSSPSRFTCTFIGCSLVLPVFSSLVVVGGCFSRTPNQPEAKKVAETISDDMWSALLVSDSPSYYLTSDQSRDARALVKDLLLLDLPSLNRKQNLLELDGKYVLWLYKKGQGELSSFAVAFTEEGLVQIHIKDQIFKTFASDKKLAERIEAFFAKASSNIPVFLANLAHPDRKFRLNAATVLGDVSAYKSKKIIPALSKAIEDRDLEVRLAAAKALIHVKGVNQLALDAIFKDLHGADANGRKKAADTLWAIGGRLPASAVPQIKKALKDNDPEVRQQAAAVFEEMGAKAESAVPYLTIALVDREWLVRAHAADALGKIGPAAKPAVPALIGLLQDEESRVQRRAIAALEEIGPAARAAVPALRKWLKDNTEFRENAVAAIAAIDPEGTEGKEEK